MQSSYDLVLVMLSIVVAMVASYSALDLAGRVAASEGRAARIWLMGGAIVMGGGIWAMHFVGMLAFSLPVTLGYDGTLTGLSLLLAMVTSGYALNLVSKSDLKTTRLLSGGLIMGAGICGMHYTGMAAMQMEPPIEYDPLLFAASVMVAVFAATAALWLAFTLRAGDSQRVILARIGAAMVMGLAIAGMHYIGMAAAEFVPGAICTAGDGKNLDADLLGYSLSAVAVGIIGLTTVASIFDARLASQSMKLLRHLEAANLGLQREIAARDSVQTALRTSEEQLRTLVEQAGDGILIFSQQAKFLDFNQRSADLLGYPRSELVGADLDLILGGGERSRITPELAGLQAGRDYKSEWEMRRKDGSTFPGEVSARLLSDGRILLILREITDRKAEQEKLRRLNRIHGVLSGINSLIVRAHERDKLFHDICRLIVERGRFKLAWIAKVKNDVAQSIASYGEDGGVLKTLKISSRAEGPGSENSGGPTAQALREQVPVVSNDVANDGRLLLWHSSFRELGIRSMMSLPLFVAKRVEGCFILYAGEPGYFDEDERKLLIELAANISYAMEFLAKEEQLDYLAYFDPLTRLANRSQLLQRLETFVKTARQTRKPLALLWINIEHFKLVNDEVGRVGGDEVLRQVAQRLTELVGNNHHIARTAGDHFAVVIDDFQDNDEVMRFFAQDLLPHLIRPMTVEGRELRLAFRAGIARLGEDGDDAESLVRNAEAAVKKARLGLDRCVFYTRELGVRFSEKIKLESQLRRAFERHEFVLFYQPKVEIRSGELVGAEALIRWNSPELGLVPPLTFISQMEETGMIMEVGRWAMEQAIEAHHHWQDQGLPSIPVAVNVSPVQLRQPNFVETVRALLTRVARNRRCLDLEITESMLIGDTEEHIGKLKEVRDLGVEIAIDDFGTGYSSLSSLVRLPITTLKIDRAFVLSMTDSADTMSVVSTIIALAHSMRLKVVAEGVDSDEQLKFLRLLRCDQIQGWLFSKALPADDFAQLLREGRRL